MKHINLVLLCFLCLPFTGFRAQQTYNLQTCLKEALQNNHNLKKSRFDKEKSEQSRKEVLGALLPQVSGSASLTDNIQKTKFIMPNFMNKFLPASMVDPNAADYMEIEMGLTYQAGVGVALNQQLLNLSLFNAVKIAQTAQQLAVLGHESKEEDIISQTASLYYAIQVTRYTVDQFDKSLSLMDNMLETMNASYDNGIIRKVDMDRLKVAKSNLETQKNAIMSVLEVQKNLLKLQMGREMDQPVSVEPIDLAFFERQSEQPVIQNFDLNQQAPYRLMMQQKTIGELQKKSALYESMPVVTFTMNYNYNYLGNDFLKS
ncbi:MAG: TolC family protein, partial [Bacteroidota bacterium]|nr:TolC family protein [Bacteroidota bacterium]